MMHMAGIEILAGSVVAVLTASEATPMFLWFWNIFLFRRQWWFGKEITPNEHC